MDYLLFENTSNYNLPTRLDETFDIVVLTPKARNLYASFETERFFRKTLFRMYISFLTKGQTQIFFVLNEKKTVLHSSVVIPSNMKYSFLGKGEYCIGPCNTIPSERGKGIYPYMLHFIISQNNNSRFYMIIKEDNYSSINGVKKAGFIQSKKRIRQTKVLKRFVLLKNEEEE